MQKHRSGTLVAGLLALVATLLVPVSPAPAGAAPAGTAGFGIQPARNGRPDARAALTYSATPGAALTDQVAVQNIGSTPLVLTVYATDATTAPDGSFALLPTSARSTQLGTWVALGGTRTIRVPARTVRGPSYVIVPLRLSVPANASPGDHAGGIVVSLGGFAVNKQGIRIKLDQRVALRVYTRVSGPLHAALAVESLHLDYAGPSVIGDPFASGTATVSYRVHNTGNITLGATQDIVIDSWLGHDVHVGRMPIVPPLLPGSSVTVRRVVAGVFPGLRVSATVHLTPVAPPGNAEPALHGLSVDASVWAFPWELIVLVLLLIAGLGLLLWRRYRRRTPRPAADPDRPSSHRAQRVRSGASR